MKKFFITLLVGSVVLCMTSDLVLAEDNQCGCPNRPWWQFWPCATPCGPSIPTNNSSDSSQFHPANQNQIQFPPSPPLDTTYHPPPKQSWFQQAWDKLFGHPTPTPVAPDFGIVKGASATAPQIQSNQLQANALQSVSQPTNGSVQPLLQQGTQVSTSASQPISASSPTQTQSVQQQLSQMTSAQKSSLNAQTDAAFYAKYPQMAGQKIDPATNPQAAQQWIALRNNILASNAGATSGSAVSQQQLPQSSAPQATSLQPAPQTQSIQQQLAQMTSAQKSSLNAQTDAAFYAQNPQMAGQKIDPVANPVAAQQWIALRNNILAAQAGATSGSPTRPMRITSSTTSCRRER